MGKIYCIMGKSATGKDTIYKRLLADEKLHLKKIVTYTTRPIRAGEKPGEEYFFIGEDEVKKLTEEGKNRGTPCLQYRSRNLEIHDGGG